MGFNALAGSPHGSFPNFQGHRSSTQRRPERTAQAVAGDLWVLD